MYFWFLQSKVFYTVVLLLTATAAVATTKTSKKSFVAEIVLNFEEYNCTCGITACGFNVVFKNITHMIQASDQ